MGPLDGVKVVEIASLAPGPFGCMVLADLGADVVRIDRPRAPGGPDPTPSGLLGRGRRSVVVDLKSPAGVELLLRLAERADVLVEAFRPGVAERLGFGPGICAERNQRLVYARMTGWGQDGPLAATAGHDIDYAAVAGALEPIGRPGERPVPPLNLIADFGGGGMLLAVGVLAALLERERSGLGQVVDVAMLDGTALLTTFLHGMLATGAWQPERGTNLLDGGAPFYDTYATADGQYVAVGAIEPQFYAELLGRLGLAGAGLPPQLDRANWPVLRARLAGAFAQRTRAEWEQVFAGSDACVAPVLTPTEAPGSAQATARGTFIEVNGVTQPAPAPRFARTPAATPPGPPTVGAHTDEVLAEAGLSRAEVSDLRQRGVVS